ncbi:fluoride efflux transporter CrcB [Haloarchaeobius iranensis]|uniref:Fluoride-specific ion channel FluC n=1 Tax=Haloarchaeobius iranensis TaxID=996166 RepID=A0A1G9T780_9EURY|nr:fluoride efflux transporter CrcB [Haloarchaeobius iranensis]SDM43609.1 camphor resistance protein CrcB [Haloarchaeobius iranensis]
MTLPAPLLVGVGGAVGAVGRQLVSVALTRRQEAVPRGTFVVNVVGSFVLAALTASAPGGDIALLVGTGACGAFTTFSSFGVATVDRLERGRWLAAALNGVGTLAACLLAVAVGWGVGLAL